MRCSRLGRALHSRRRVRVLNIGMEPMIAVSDYFGLFVEVIIGIGLVFELPALIFLLTLRVTAPYRGRSLAVRASSHAQGRNHRTLHQNFKKRASHPWHRQGFTITPRSTSTIPAAAPTDTSRAPTIFTTENAATRNTGPIGAVATAPFVPEPAVPADSHKTHRPHGPITSIGATEDQVSMVGAVPERINKTRR